MRSSGFPMINGLPFLGNGLFADGSAAAPSVSFLSARGTGVFLAAANSLGLATNGAVALTLSSTQQATFVSDISAGVNSYIGFTARSYISSPSDGILRLTNSAVTDFTRLQFGGTTSAFPALARNGSGMNLVKADNSDFAVLSLANAILKNAAANGAAGEVVLGNTTQTTVGAAGGATALPATPTGYLRFKIATTDFVLPYYAQA